MLRSLASHQQPEPLQENNQSLFKHDVRPIFLPNSAPLKQPNSQEIQQCTELIQKMISSQNELETKAQQILEEVNQRDYSKGLGYYNSKNLLLLEYLIHLQYYQLFKVNGESLTEGEGLELYKRLAYLKTLLTKLSPVEKKLEYQKNKLLKYSEVVRVQPQPEKKQLREEQEEIEEQSQPIDHSQNDEGDDQEPFPQESGEQDALNYQPRPDALMAVKQKKQKQQLNEGKYVPPKISAVLSKEDKKARRLEIQQQRKKAFLIRKFRGDLQDDEEAREVGVGSEVAEKIKRKFREKISVEEDNFMRMPESKQEKFWRKSLIRDKQRSNPLQEEFKEIQTIKQIFTERQTTPIPNPLKRKSTTPLKRSSPSPLKRKAPSGKIKGGSKKVKRNQ